MLGPTGRTLRPHRRKGEWLDPGAICWWKSLPRPDSDNRRVRSPSRTAGRVLALTAGVATAFWVFAAVAQSARPAFGAIEAPTTGPVAAHGGYSAGCLAGAVKLPETGPRWQAMRLSRNRYWGHPEAIAFIERLSRAAQGAGWAGLYVGDVSQPRGGPMGSGHRSHQIGLDADIWLLPPHSLTLTVAEREALGSPSVVAANRLEVNARWTDAHARVLQAAASDASVARVFVNAAIKRRLCATADGDDADWLRKTRPWWGHASHFHVRLHCPDGADCVAQHPPPPGDGCDATLEWWFTEEALNPPPPDPQDRPPEPMLADLPVACRAVLEGG